MFSVRVVDVALDVTLNYIQILTVAQISFYGKFTSQGTIEIIAISFGKKLHTNQFALSPHVTYTDSSETNDRMLMTFFRPSLAKPTVSKQWRTEERGVWGVQTPPPRNTKVPPKSCQTQPYCENC